MILNYAKIWQILPKIALTLLIRQNPNISCKKLPSNTDTGIDYLLKGFKLHIIVSIRKKREINKIIFRTSFPMGTVCYTKENFTYLNVYHPVTSMETKGNSTIKVIICKHYII